MFDHKTLLGWPFCCCFVTPTTVKLAEIIPWIHHSQVKPASLDWECIPDPFSPYKITFRMLEPFLNRTLLSRRQHKIMDKETSALF
jgi:hypothetical protein